MTAGCCTVCLGRPHRPRPRCLTVRMRASHDCTRGRHHCTRGFSPPEVGTTRGRHHSEVGTTGTGSVATRREHRPLFLLFVFAGMFAEPRTTLMVQLQSYTCHEGKANKHGGQHACQRGEPARAPTCLPEKCASLLASPVRLVRLHWPPSEACMRPPSEVCMTSQEGVHVTSQQGVHVTYQGDVQEPTKIHASPAN